MADSIDCRTRKLVLVLLASLPGVLVAKEATAQVTEPPPPLPERPLEFPAFQETALPNGLEIIVLEHRNQPVASARLYIPAGSSLDPADKGGLASMAAGVLTQGTENRDAREIAETIEGVGASLNASAGRDFFTVSVSGLAEHLPLGMELLADVTLNATFPEDEIELHRRRTLSSLQAALGQPQQVAVRRFFLDVYGEDHPYGPSPESGTVQALTRDDLTEFRGAHLRPDRALLVVAGDVGLEEVEELARTHLGAWEPGAPSPMEFPAAAMRDETRISLVHRPGSVQSTVLVGHVGPEAKDPDFIPLEVMNRVLGGGSDSRLFRILREEKGWTYGSYSQIGRRAEEGFFLALADVRTEVTDSTVVELLHQIERLKDEPVPEEEVSAAISYLAGSFPLTIETASQIAGQIAENRLLGLPAERLTGYREAIRAVDPEDVRRVARGHIHPDRLAVIVVGDAQEVLAGLDGIAEVFLYDVEGNPLSREEVLGEAISSMRDGSLLTPMVRTYDVFMQDESAGSITYSLERDRDSWVARAEMATEVITQDQELRFSYDGLEAQSLEQESSQQGARVSASLRLQDGRLVGGADLPPQAGGSRTFDQALSADVLLPGMDEYVLAASSLAEGEELSFTAFDLIAGEVIPVTFRVTGTETLTVGAGTFDTYRVETVGGPAPLVLHLRKSVPHILVRQEYAGAPLRVELSSIR